MTKRRFCTMLVSASIVSLAQVATAQSLNLGGKASNFGSISLTPGFTPDPHEVSITSGGSLNVRNMNLGSGCVGYATGQPDFILRLSGDTDFIKFYNEGDGDTGLVINGPNGRWHCDDDSHTGTNPMVEISNASDGQYDVWVTSYSSDDNISSTLHISELRATGKNPESGRLTLGGTESNFGSISLSPGFTPDPHEVSLTSGGSLNVRNMDLGSGCVGYATGQPDFILHLSGDTDFIKFYNEGNGDTGLVINDPNGQWHCDDDSHTGTNPMVEISNAADGQYDVWVTSYSSDDNISGTLHISELRSTGSNSGGERLTLGGDDSNFGSVSLQPGFAPDPHEVSITSGGSLAVSQMNLGSGCVGYATRIPDFIVNLSGNSDFLRFYVEGNGDTGLVINDGNGVWHCDDDGHTGTNPMVSINNAPDGQYDVWVSSYSNDDNVSAKLFVTELRNLPNRKGN